MKMAKINYKEDFFERETNLTVSGQLEGELAAMGLGRNLHFRTYLQGRKFQYYPPLGGILDD
jgi:aspartyl/asparaginyl-tRNA synthetase